MIIRDMKPGDKALYFKMSYDFYSGDAVLYPISDTNLERTFEQALNNSPYMRGLVLENEEKVVGYALLAFYWSCEAGGMVALLEELYLDPSCRGQHFGSEFMDWFIDTYKDKMTRLRLEVCPENTRVIKLYESYGFKTLDYIQMIRE